MPCVEIPIGPAEGGAGVNVYAPPGVTNKTSVITLTAPTTTSATMAGPTSDASKDEPTLTQVDLGDSQATEIGDDDGLVRPSVQQ